VCGRGSVGGLGDKQGHEGERGPEPADLDKVEIEDVVLASEVVDRVWRGKVHVGGDGGGQRSGTRVTALSGASGCGRKDRKE
jgi:hypothetical protein